MKILFEHADSYIAQLKDIKIDGLVFYRSAIEARGLDIESFVKKHYPSGMYYIVIDDTGGIDSDGWEWKFFYYPSPAGEDLPARALVKEDMRENFDDKILWLSDLAEKTNVLVLGTTSSRLITGLEINVSVNPWMIAGKGEIILPTGKRVNASEWHPTANGGKAWIDKLGFSWDKLYNSDSSELTKFNIASFLAMRTMKEEIKEQGFSNPPPKENKGSAKDKIPEPKESVSIIKRGTFCDECGWQGCRYFQKGSVCIRDAMIKKQAKNFGSRDVNIIKKNMAHLLEEEAQRYAMGRELEKDLFRPIKEVSTIFNNLMNGLDKLKSLEGNKDKPLIDARTLHVGDEALNKLKDKYGEEALKGAIDELVKKFVPPTDNKSSK